MTRLADIRFECRLLAWVFGLALGGLFAGLGALFVGGFGGRRT